MLVIFSQLDKSIDVTFRCCLLPKADGFFEISSSLLQDGKAAYGFPEIALAQAHLQSPLEETGGGLPLTKILIKFSQCNHIQAVLDRLLERVGQQGRRVTQQCGHRHHIHGVVIEDTF